MADFPTLAAALTVPSVVASAAEADPDGVALTSPGREPLARRALAAQVGRTGGQLRAAGLDAAARVAVVLPDGPDLAVAFLGVSGAMTCAPLNPRYTVDELRFYLGDLAADRVIVPAAGHPAAEEAAAALGVPVLRLHAESTAGCFSLHDERGPLPVVEPVGDASPDGIALLLHTSGTTARPKLVPLRHSSLARSATNVAASLRLGPDDRSLVVMPLFHIHGLVAGLLAPLASGGEVHVPVDVTGATLADAIARSGATWYTAVPSLHQAVLEHVRTRPIDHRLRVVRSCSSPLPPAVASGLEEALGVPVVEAYGMTECAHQIAANPLPPAARKPGSVGLPTGVAVAVVDEEGRPLPAGEVGEVVVRGDNVITGYLDNPAADAASFRDGWFRTGDQGRLDEDGYLHLTGRLKELVNRAGEKIAPREVEDVLLEHPAVAAAVVFAVPDSRLGEQVAAAVVAREEVTERELRVYVAQKLAPFKVPRRIVFCDSVPKGPTGKLARRGLAERFGLSDLDDDPADEEEPRPPAGLVECLVAGMWEDVLGHPVNEVHARFLDVGGDSLAAMRLLARLRDELDLDVGMLDLFDSPTIARQSVLLADKLLDG